MLNCLNLAGQSAKIAIIRNVERSFEIAFDPTDAPKWSTAGDLFESLLAELPEGQRSSQRTWTRFTEALAQDFAEATKIGSATRLVGPSAWQQLRRRLRSRPQSE